MDKISEAVATFLAILDRMEIPYLLGGSAASSVHGIPRSTMDADFVADLRPEQVEEFISLLQPDFYADRATVREALERGRAFNLIHYTTAFKIDIFPLGQDEYSRASFVRRRFERSHAFGSQPMECAVGSPEDTILRKLEWYRAGGESSERQWNDLRGILKVSGPLLDTDYMLRWAKYLHVEDLLERLLRGK